MNPIEPCISNGAEAPPDAGVADEMAAVQMTATIALEAAADDRCGVAEPATYVNPKACLEDEAGLTGASMQPKNWTTAELIYSAFSPQDRAFAKEAAQRVRRLWSVNVFDIGRELIAVKERLGHGRFTGWLSIEFPKSRRLAQMYMNVASRLGAKREIFAHLEQTTLYRLAAPSTPPAVREQVIEWTAAGQRPPDKKIIDLIKRQKKVRKREKEAPRSPATMLHIERSQETTAVSLPLSPSPADIPAAEQARREVGAGTNPSTHYTADQKAAAAKAIMLMKKLGVDFPQLQQLAEIAGPMLFFEVLRVA
jgi:hypothetical protein